MEPKNNEEAEVTGLEEASVEEGIDEMLDPEGPEETPEEPAAEVEEPTEAVEEPKEPTEEPELEQMEEPEDGDGQLQENEETTEEVVDPVAEPISLTQEELEARIAAGVQEQQNQWVQQQMAQQEAQRQAQEAQTASNQQSPMYEFVNEQDFDGALTDPQQFNTLLNKVYYFAMNQMQAQAVPAIRESMKHEFALEKASTEFYNNNSDLSDHGEVVNTIAARLAQSGQQFTDLGQFFGEVETQARKQLNLPRPKTPTAATPVRRGQSLKKQRKQNPGLAGGTASRAGAPKAPTGMEAEIAEMLED